MPAGGPRVSLVVVENGGGHRGARRSSPSWPGRAAFWSTRQPRIRPGRQSGGGGRAGRRAPVLESRHPRRGRSLHGDRPRLRRPSRGRGPRPAPPRLRRPGRFPNPQFTIHNHQSLLSLLPTARTSSRFSCAGSRALVSDARRAASRRTRSLPNNRRRRRARYADRDRNSPFEVEQAAAAALAIRKSEFRRLQRLRRAVSCRRGSKTWISAPAFPARGSSSTGRTRNSGTAAASLRRPWVTPAFCRSITATPFATGASTTVSRPVFSTGRSSSPGCSCASSSFRLRPAVPRPRGEAARAYLATLALAFGVAPGNRQSQITITNHKSP